ncbi:MAG: divergent polysaccharide deacetylase family protein [Pseudomonadota bacterium]
MATAQAGDVPAAQPVIAIIIDDLGNRPQADRRVLALPGPVACAILPDTPSASRLAMSAGMLGKEVLLHQPLQSLRNNSGLGPGAITVFSTQAELASTLSKNISELPNVVGVNNHMGSLLTRQAGPMDWFMHTLSKHQPLFFIDSRTTAASVALDTARQHGVPSARRDVFLDGQLDEAAIAFQFARLKRLATERGGALAIGHPHPETLAFLERELPLLSAAGFELVSVSEYIGRRSGHTPSASGPASAVAAAAGSAAINGSALLQ